jgi:hypothetical protein
MNDEERDRETKSKIAEAACWRICRAVIRNCQQIEPILFGDDSPLGNAWDDICVQEQQADRSLVWDESYGATLIQAIKWELSKLDDATRLAIWQQTDEGIDCWVDERKPPTTCSADDIAPFILNQYVLPAAERFSNKRIRKHLGEC